MKEKLPLLVIYLAVDASQDEYWWLTPDAPASALTAEQAAGLSKKTPALVLLDAAAIRLDCITLPPGVKPHEVGLLLEDHLSQPLEDIELLVLEKKGHELKVATLDKSLAEQWRMRLTGKHIRVARWIPESLCFASLWQQPEQLLLVDQQRAWLWQADQQILLKFPVAWINSAQTAPLLTAATQQISINDLPQKARVPWLARGIPEKINLWPESWLNKIPAKNYWQYIKLTPKQWGVASPWLLLVVILISQQVFTWLAKPVSVVDKSTIRQEVELLNQRLDNYVNHLSYQQQRLDAWQKLLSQLHTKQHLQLVMLQFNEQGIFAKLVGVKAADQRALKSLNGDWNFTGEQAVWELQL